MNTPRLISNGTPATVWRWDQLEPFGVSAADENPSGLGAFEFNLRFPGQYFDKETGIHYNYFRDYDPSIGRYGESDPIGLRGGVNTYTYANANPLSVTDPLGLLSVTVSTGGSGFVGTMGASAASGVAIDFSSGNLFDSLARLARLPALVLALQSDMASLSARRHPPSRRRTCMNSDCSCAALRCLAPLLSFLGVTSLKARD